MAPPIPRYFDFGRAPSYQALPGVSRHGQVREENQHSRPCLVSGLGRTQPSTTCDLVRPLVLGSRSGTIMVCEYGLGKWKRGEAEGFMAGGGGSKEVTMVRNRLM